MYAEVEGIGNESNMDVETIAILQALGHCKRNNFERIISEMNFLNITKMVRREWRVPWQQAECRI